MPPLSDITVRPADSTADLKAFVQFPFDLYRGDRHWVPPLRRDVAHLLDPQKNAFFEHGNIQPFLARDGSGRVVGRIAAIYNGAHLETHGDEVGFFGFFETVEHYPVAAALLDAAAAWLRTQNLTAMRGPTNPSMNDVAGLLVGGFDRDPSVMMPYNKPYYEGFLLRHGFERAMTMWAYFGHLKYSDQAKLRRAASLVRRRYPSVSVRTLDMARYDEEAALVLGLYNEAWSHNWGHVPMRPAEFAQLAQEMKQVVDPRIVYVVEDAGEPVGFSLSLPNVNHLLKHVPNGRLFPTGALQMLARAKAGAVHEVRTVLMGVRPSHQGRGLDGLMHAHLMEMMIETGEYDSAEMSWVLDVNVRLRNLLENMGAVKDKEYALFETPLDA